jgi:hypothetical protein
VQPVFAGTLDFPLFTTHIRYKLLVDALRRHFDAASAPQYGPCVHLLQGKLYELHDAVVTAGVGAYSRAREQRAVDAMGPSGRSSAGELKGRLSKGAGKEDAKVRHEIPQRSSVAGHRWFMGPRVVSTPWHARSLGMYCWPGVA